MDKIMTIKGKILHFLQSQGISREVFYRDTGMSASNFKGVAMQSELGGDKIAKILTCYPQLSADWLLTGKEPMIKKMPQKKAVVSGLVSETGEAEKRIPLVHEKVAAGFGSADFSIAEADVKEYYIIPKFRYNHVDFMIEVSGISMMPHLHPGDVIACSIIRDSKFLQWNRCHVIATREQGLLVKRLKEGSDSEHLLAVSDNADYPPFEIPKEDITGIALVVGSVSLE